MLGIYFSGTGNTRYCVKRFLTQCSSDSYICAYAIEDLQAIKAIKSMKDSDILVFGYSVQYSNLPKMLKDFIMEYGELWKNKKIYIIATMGLFSGDGAGMLGRLLEKYGAEIVGGLHLRMPDSICDEKVLKHTEEEEQRTIEKSEAKLDRAAQSLKAGHPTKEGIGFFYHIAGLFGQRLYFYNRTRDYSDKLKVDTDKCIGCGLCAKQCPMHNIEMSDTKMSDIKKNGSGRNHVDQEVAIPQGKCTMCYRCVNECPQKAITLLGQAVVRQRKELQ